MRTQIVLQCMNKSDREREKKSGTQYSQYHFSLRFYSKYMISRRVHLHTVGIYNPFDTSLNHKTKIQLRLPSPGIASAANFSKKKGETAQSMLQKI